MNIDIDRPLDDIVHEDRSKSRKERRKAMGNKKKGNKSNDVQMKAVVSLNSNMSAQKQASKKAAKNASAMDLGVAKKNRRKMKKNKGAQGDTGMEIDRSAFKQEKAEIQKKKKTAPAGAIGTRLSVANLNHAVSNEDINQLFRDIGPLRSAGIIFGANGQPTGRAEVIFVKREHALEAIAKYNGVPLDNRPLKISLATDNGMGGSNKPRASMDIDTIRISTGKEGQKVITTVRGSRMKERKANRMKKAVGGSAMMADWN
mmetsp:Transcript_4039/g.7086  ORF Transcript_4039/g.7086 Transcript_4039/m.7086 type:complete len:259 (-) Transcript_4039:1199-1975(-)